MYHSHEKFIELVDTTKSTYRDHERLSVQLTNGKFHKFMERKRMIEYLVSDLRAITKHADNANHFQTSETSEGLAK